MRYVSIFTHEGPSTPPTPEMMAKMGQLVEQGMKEGWLVTTEGVHTGEKGLKVTRSKAGKYTIVDGPFAEAKELLGGYAILEARNREHLLELTRKFLDTAGAGTCEIHELFVPPKS
jgi:hypothetical protein